MFFPEGQIRVFHYGEPVSMRLSFDGPDTLARHRLQQDPLSGNLFAFINRRVPRSKFYTSTAPDYAFGPNAWSKVDW